MLDFRTRTYARANTQLVRDQSNTDGSFDLAEGRSGTVHPPSNQKWVAEQLEGSFDAESLPYLLEFRWICGSAEKSTDISLICCAFSPRKWYCFGLPFMSVIDKKQPAQGSGSDLKDSYAQSDSTAPRARKRTSNFGLKPPLVFGFFRCVRILRLGV